MCRLFVLDSVDGLASCYLVDGQEACKKRDRHADEQHKRDLSYSEIEERYADALASHPSVDAHGRRDHRRE